MENHPAQVRLHLKRLIMLRLLFVTLFLFFGVAAREVHPSLFSLILFVLALSIVYAFWLVWGKRILALAAIQIVVDFMIETILIYATGGFDSVYTTLMVFTIFSSGLVLGSNYGFLSSVFGSLLFFSVVLKQQWGINADWLYVGYIAYVKISIFLLVGFLSTHFAQRFNKMEQQINLNERLAILGEMAAQLAHEIRNPLMSITGSVELLNRHLTDKLSEKDQHLMETVAHESERLTGLLTQVLNYTQDEKLVFEKCSVEQILDEVFLVLESGFHYPASTKIIKSYKRKNATAELDRDKMKQVFINLIVNALESMPQGGQFLVDIERADGSLTVKFEDTGCGISADQMKKLFIPFASSRKKGTGIGLAVSHKIVRQHGGKIKVQSKENKGTSIWITLPVA